MKKNHFIILIVLLFIVTQIGMWMTFAALDDIIDETGFLHCIHGKTSPALCEKFSFYKTIFSIGGISIIVMLIFRKKIIRGN